MKVHLSVQMVSINTSDSSIDDVLTVVNDVYNMESYLVARPYKLCNMILCIVMSHWTCHHFGEQEECVLITTRMR